VRQCQLSGISRSGLYYRPVEESAENLELMRLLDEQYTRTPFYGVRRMASWLGKQGYGVNVKRVRRLLRQMGLEAIYPKPRLSVPGPGHRIYPHRLRGLKIDRPNSAQQRCRCLPADMGETPVDATLEQAEKSFDTICGDASCHAVRPAQSPLACAIGAHAPANRAYRRA